MKNIGIIGVLLLLIAIGGTPQAWGNETESIAIQAYSRYTAGEEADSINGRIENFKEALSLYRSLEKTHPSGSLFYNIGNSFFQLRQYPWAILYYNRALQYMPRESVLKENLLLAQEKAGVAGLPQQTIWKFVLFVRNIFSYNEIVLGFLLFFVLSLGMLSWYVWQRHGLLRMLAGSTLLCGLLFFLCIILLRYIAPIEAVVVNASMVRRDAGTHYGVVSEKPLIAGTVVTVDYATPGGEWVKIKTPSGDVGFVSYNKIRMVRWSL